MTANSTFSCSARPYPGGGGNRRWQRKSRCREFGCDDYLAAEPGGHRGDPRSDRVRDIMRIMLFGTYDAGLHPRIATIAEGLAASGFDVTECNAPLGLSTADRVAMLARPWIGIPAMLGRLASRWATLAAKAFRGPAPDVVVVGYLGHFDVLLARLIFRVQGVARRRRIPIVLDHLINASDTGKDRRLDGGPRQVLLRMIDAAALRAADVIVVDTDEHLANLPERHRAGAVVVHVGAPSAWYEAVLAPGDDPLSTPGKGGETPLSPPSPGEPGTDRRAPGPPTYRAGDNPLRVVFF